MLGKATSGFVPGQRFLVIYSGVLTAAVCAALLCGFVVTPEKAKFKQLEVQRIDVVEPDGTLRMVIHNKALRPGAINHGKEYAHPNPKARQGAGLLFFNDEGTENGGLSFGGLKGADGKVVADSSLSFDKYDQDQTVQLVYQQHGEQESSGLVLSDRPNRPLLEDMEEATRINALPESEQAKARAAIDPTRYGVGRIGIVRSSDGLATIALADGAGKPRIKLSVAADGAAHIQFLDAKGQVVDELGPGAKR